MITPTIIVRVQNMAEPDDVLTFTPDKESTGFDLTIIKNTENSREKVMHDDVESYLVTFFRSLEMCEKTGISIQFDVPGFPACLLFRCDFLNNREKVLDYNTEKMFKSILKSLIPIVSD